MKASWLLLIAVLTAPAAIACSPVKSVDIFFSKNSATVSGDQVLRLAEWTALLRARYPNRQLLAIGANVEQGERGGDALGRLREQAVVHLIGDLQFSARQVEIAEKIHVLPAGALGSGPRNDVKRVEMDLLPACPHECPCQRE